MARNSGGWLTVVLMLGLASLSAETVTWTATGSVDSASGGYGSAGVSPGDVALVQFSYNSDAGFTPLKNVLGEVERDYWNGIELTVRVAIGTHFWNGTVETANEGSPYTLFTRDQSLFAFGGEKLEATLSEADNAVFTSFPLSLGAGKDSVKLDFSATGMEFLKNGIASTQVAADQVTAASGVITTEDGAETSTVAFTIHPGTLEIRGDGSSMGGPKVAISLGPDTVTLSWQTKDGTGYTVEFANDLDTTSGWNFLMFVPGDGGGAAKTFPRTSHREFYRVVVNP